MSYTDLTDDLEEEHFRKLSDSQKWIQVFKYSDFHLKAQIFSLATNVTFLEVTGSFDLFSRKCLNNQFVK